MLRILSILSLCLLINTCNNTGLPAEKISQFTYKKEVSLSNDTLSIALENPLHCPIRLIIEDETPALNGKLVFSNPTILKAKKDTVLHFYGFKNKAPFLKIRATLGDTSSITGTPEVELPFLKNKTSRIIQGYNGDFTHNSTYSRYAIDFAMKRNDTICAATDGFVVGVVEDYKDGGPGKEWRPFANFITLYDPVSGIYTQYVHLEYKGSLVAIGDSVKAGSPIGLVGLTGQTTVEHLHFNCLVPVNSPDGIKSIPVTFKEGFTGYSLKKNDRVTKSFGADSIP